jgi:4-hydroxybenzoate polyprenyltransferase
MKFSFLFFLPAVSSIPSKLAALTKITRISENILPVSGLVAISALTPPSLPLQNTFMTTFGMVHALTYVSMIVNDIWDLEADRINHPTRPLVTGDLTVKEAWIAALTLTAAYIGGGIHLSQRGYWMFPMITIYLYTPVLKKIPLIKNLSCAAVISTTVDFIRGTFYSPNSYPLRKLIFIWSMTNEIFLDIADEVGDFKAGVRTLPVLFGKTKTIVGLFFFICWNQMSRDPFFIAYFPFYYYLWRVHRNGSTKKNIKEVCKQLTFVLLGIGLYLTKLEMIS